MCVFRNDLSTCVFIASFILNDFQTLRFRQEMLSFQVDLVGLYAVFIWCYATSPASLFGETRLLDMGMLWVEEDVAFKLRKRSCGDSQGRFNSSRKCHFGQTLSCAHQENQEMRIKDGQEVMKVPLTSCKWVPSWTPWTAWCFRSPPQQTMLNMQLFSAVEAHLQHFRAKNTFLKK
jgi:hypothetical protein